MTAAAGARHRVDELCAAVIRAVSADRDVHLSGGTLHRGRRVVPMTAPHLRPAPDVDGFAAFRGVADGMGLRLAHSDPDLHRALRPHEPVPRTVFELLEQFRTESLAEDAMPGVLGNLRQRHEQWALGFHHEGHTETARGILLYTVALICRSHVTGQPVPAATEDVIEATRFWLAPRLGHQLHALRRHRFDQTAFAVPALAIAHQVAELLGPGPERAERNDDRPPSRFAFFAADDGDDSDSTRPSTGRAQAFDDEPGSYRVFTTAYDRERDVGSLVRPALLAEYRQRLDQRIAGRGISAARLARQAGLLLSDPVRRGWDGGQEEGLIDGRRLAQLVASPTERRLFRDERTERLTNCFVTFLIDCSGSMKGHAESLAMITDVSARALELAGVGSEVLGFTTSAWHGGRPMRDWRRAGRPRNPGRLNERLHLVFKDADTPYRRARRAIAGLLKQDLFREGVNGEAIDWACRRLRRRDEERKLLVVLTDGSPADGATALTNDARYLDRHLAEVVHRQEADGVVQILGVGIELDLSPTYRRAHTVDLTHGVGYRELVKIVSACQG